jgi:Yip1 domain
MSLIDRAKNILLSPTSEWEAIAKEQATVSGLFTGYAIPLMILPIVGQVVAVGLLGIGAGGLAPLGLPSIGVMAAGAMGAVGFVLGLVVLYAMIFIVNAVSPSFSGKSDMTQAAKLMVYASTPAWVAGLMAPFLGMIGGLLSFAAIGYVVYLIYQGIRPVMEAPQEKVAGFTVVIVLIYIVLSFVITVFIGGLLIAALLGGGMMAAGAASGM